MRHGILLFYYKRFKQPKPWSKVLLEKLTDSQLVKKFSEFIGIWRSITAFTTARNLSLSWARSFQSIIPFHCLKIPFNIIIPYET